ncbi:type II secretion system protein F [Oxobacter pfennigii]|uniref:Type II secretion system protein F n=1 Tax=Oxobacter pfennigii TaxID=36849 RepID=A0A0P8YYR1_9CLOT|nr:type II secretion system F family protein [Oxobacter pfennigii]KPU44938.1 type II secretion system protein F [Oxobacter pfennigii]
MPEFIYKAKSRHGKVLKGTMDLADRALVIKSLKEKGYFPFEIAEAYPKRYINHHLLNRVSLKDISVFCRQFSAIAASGITIVKGLDILRQQIDNKVFRQVLTKVYEEVQKGKALSQSMGQFKVFPDLLVNVIEAGEVSGRLDEAFKRMAIYYDKENALKNKIISALVYPMVVMCAAIAVIVFLNFGVLPMFAETFKSFNAELPLPTKIIIGLNHQLKNYWYFFLSASFLAIYLSIKYIKTPKGRYKYHHFLLKLPLIGDINKERVASRFSKTLSMLLESGIPLLKAMDAVEKTISNAVVEEGILKCKDELKNGAGLLDTISSIKVFPSMLLEMVRIGEETGTLDMMLSKASDFYDDEADEMISRLSTLVEPIIIVFLSVIVGFIIVSILLPMMDMYKYMG